MKSRVLSLVVMVSMGINVLVFYQNCGEPVDIAALQEGSSDSVASLKTSMESLAIETNTQSETTKAIPKPKKPSLSFSSIDGNLKVVTADWSQNRNGADLKLEIEVPVAFSHNFMGLDLALNSKNFYVVDEKNRVLAKLPVDKANVLQKACQERYTQNAQAYQYCVYSVKVADHLDVSESQVKSKKLFITTSKQGGLKMSLMWNQKQVATKSLPVALHFKKVELPKTQALSLKKETASIPVVSQKKRSHHIAKTNPIQIAVKPAALPKKKIDHVAIDDLPDGVYCHIQVLNPPQLDILSDQKKTGTYYEDAETCREVALQVSRSYCGYSMMGELDIHYSIKDHTAAGDKVLEKFDESIECDAKKDVASASH